LISAGVSSVRKSYEAETSICTPPAPPTLMLIVYLDDSTLGGRMLAFGNACEMYSTNVASLLL
jgi:hypothetical protein